jgi:hypothetical protein
VDNCTRYLSTILAGLSIQAANGSTKAELKRTAERDGAPVLGLLECVFGDLLTLGSRNFVEMSAFRGGELGCR